MTNYELIRRLSKEATLCSYPTTEDNTLVVCDAEAWGGWLKILFNDHEDVIEIQRIPTTDEIPKTKEPLD